MEMKKRIIKGCAWALALLTAVSVLALKQDAAYGAKGVDANQKRSLSFSLAKNVGGEGIPEGDLKQDITIRYYRVAGMNVPTGSYSGMLQGGWTDLKNVKYKVVMLPDEKGFDVKVDGVDTDYSKCTDFENKEREANLEEVTLDISDTERKNAWEAIAKKAAFLVEEGKVEELGSVVLKDTANEAYAPEVEEQSPGMYLILADPVKSANYTYNFKPYLISVPTNYYADGTPNATDDSWIYNVKVGLKPEQEERYGRLRITKNLTDFNDRLGSDASFIFEVKADKDGRIVYSDVVRLGFTGAGSQSVTIGPEAGDGVDVIGKIPAGSKVTVTEVYSGASYEADSEVQTVNVMAAYEADQNNVVTVSFTNHYNGGINGGSSVVNHFEYDAESENWKKPAQEYMSRPTEGGNTQ